MGRFTSSIGSLILFGLWLAAIGTAGAEQRLIDAVKSADTVAVRALLDQHVDVNAPQEDGTLKAQAVFNLDRTLWNVHYGSGKLFERLGMHLVNDLISIEMFIVAH